MSAGFAGLDEVWVKLLASFGITDYDEATGRRMRAAYNTAVARLRDNWNKERYKRLPDWDQRMNVFSRLVPDNLAFKKLMRAGTEHESTAAIINPSTLMVDFLSFDGELDESCRVCGTLSVAIWIPIVLHEWFRNSSRPSSCHMCCLRIKKP